MDGQRRLRLTTASGALLAAVLATRDAPAFVPAGHLVLEVMAYREMADDPHDRAVLATLMRDGVIEAPLCFGDGSPTCRARFESDPLAWWPAPRTDAPDRILARQFDHVGQCFHFMAQQSDESAPPAPYVDPKDPADPHVAYGLIWDAYYRCVNQLGWVLQRTVLDPIEARTNARGMYELMHAVMDSYSAAHTERDYAAWQNATGRDPAIRFLRVWQPTVANPFADANKNTRHELFETRDDDYVDRERIVAGRPCTYYVPRPYTVPPECLSTSGRLAVAALRDLMRLVVELRATRGQTPAAIRTRWTAFVDRHLRHAATRPPLRPAPPHEREKLPFLFVGTRAQLAPADGIFDDTLAVRYLLTSAAVDPLSLSFELEAGSRHDFPARGAAFLLRQDVDLMLTLGTNFWLGVAPVSIGYVAGRDTAAQLEAVARARLDWFEPFGLERIALSAWGGEYSWLDQRARAALGLSFMVALSEREPGRLDRVLRRRPSAVADPSAWTPPAPWDSQLRSWAGPIWFGAHVGATTGSGLVSGPGGKIREGVQVDVLKRNAWGDINPFSVALLVQDVLELTSGTTPHTSLAAFLSPRLYVLGPLGVIGDVGLMTPDLSGASLHPWAFESRAGVVLTVGRLDVIVESPTVPRTDFNAGEILTARLGLDAIAF
jgi:hypothetical protein